MRDNRKKIIEFLQTQGKAREETRAVVIGAGSFEIFDLINTLVDAGVLKQDGDTFLLTTNYLLKADEPLPLDTQARLLSALLDIYTSHGWVGRLTLANWLGVDVFRVRGLQRTLVKQRRLRLDKHGRYALVRKRSAAA